MSGCDDLSFLRGFLKGFCFKTFLRFSDKIVPESSEVADKLFNGNIQDMLFFFVRFLAHLYGHQFSSSFQPDEITALVKDLSCSEDLLTTIRKRTWHKTIVTNNTVPPLTAIELHVRRIHYVLQSFGKATIPIHNLPDPETHGWVKMKFGDQDLLVPKWDSEENIRDIGAFRKVMLKNVDAQKTVAYRIVAHAKN